MDYITISHILEFIEQKDTFDFHTWLMNTKIDKLMWGNKGGE